MAEETKDTITPENPVPETGATEVPAEEKKGRKAKKESTEASLAAAEQRADDAEQKAEQNREALLRTAAEYENFRKRSQKERDAAFSEGVAHAALEMLPIIDTLEAAASAETTDAEYKKGVELTLQKCAEVFGRLGIEEIEALGQPFDPELHDAVMQHAAEGAESGTVTQVVRKGYQMGDRVVRHCMVGVCP